MRTIFFLILAICMLGGQLSYAATNDIKNIFDNSIGYKIYFSSYGERRESVIENVEIVGFTQIGGRDFLVIKSAGFSLTSEQGYILFDSVTAIIPDRNIKILDRIKTDGRKY